MEQYILDRQANEAATALTRALHAHGVERPGSEICAAIRSLIFAEIAAATPNILRQAGVVFKS